MSPCVSGHLWAVADLQVSGLPTAYMQCSQCSNPWWLRVPPLPTLRITMPRSGRPLVWVTSSSNLLSRTGIAC